MSITKTSIALALALTATWFVPCVKADDADDSSLHYFSFGPTFGLNFDASFKHIGYPSASTQPGSATGGGIDRTYDDGYVHVDSSGNAGGQTWNWGYQNASQAGDHSITMHAESADGTLHQNSDPQYGFDLPYGRRLGKVLGGKWGFQAAFDFTEVCINDDGPFIGSANVISDTFVFPANNVPDAPYAGSFEGPGALLGDSPSRSTGLESVQVTGQRTLEAQIYALRTGVFYEHSFWKRLSVQFSGGLAFAVVDGRYSFNENVAFGSGTVIQRKARSSGTDFLVGGYVDGKLLYALTPRTQLYTGVQYENLGNYSRTTAGERAQLKLDAAVNILFGVQFRF